MVKKFLFIALFFVAILTRAQLHEVGLQVGGSNYIGDIGSEQYIRPNSLAYGVVYKYNLNPRVALRGTFTLMGISDDDADSDNQGRQLRGYKFTNDIKELAVGIEFSWFEYSLFTQDKIQTPYMLFEIAAFNYKVVDEEISPNNFNYKNKTSIAIPFGLGYKRKLAEGFAISAEIGMRLTFVDDIDYNNSDIPALEFGNDKTIDWYAFSGISLVYTFGRPPCNSTRRY